MKKKTPIQAVIFDMDGVIVDSEPIQSRSLEIILKQYGKTPIYNDQGLIQTVGIAGDGSYIEILEKHNIKEEIAIFKEKRGEVFVKLLKSKKLSSMKGFTQLISWLKKSKYKIALATNRRLDHAEIILEGLKTKKHFEVVVGPSPKLKYKPAPDIYLAAAKALSLKPPECVVIEDSESGIVSAYHAGMKVIAVPNKYTRHQDFSKADKIVKSLSDITMEVLNSL